MIKIRESSMFRGDTSLKKIAKIYFNSVSDLIKHIEKTTDYDVLDHSEYRVDLMDRTESDDERESFHVRHRNGKVTIEL